MVVKRGLSNRELDVLRRAAEGMHHAEIAESLGLSLSTVRANLYNARRRLNIPVGASITALVAEARRRGILEGV